LRLSHWTRRKLQGWTVLIVTKRDEADKGHVVTAAKNYEAEHTCRTSRPAYRIFVHIRINKISWLCDLVRLLHSSNKFESENARTGN
jgi:hypothetical protein